MFDLLWILVIVFFFLPVGDILVVQFFWHVTGIQVEKPPSLFFSGERYFMKDKKKYSRMEICLQTKSHMC